MKRFRNILVATEGRDQDALAVSTAVDLARSNGAKLTVVAASDRLPERGLRLLPGLDVTVHAQAREALSRLITCHAAGWPVESRVLIGTPFLEIGREVIRSGHDLLMKAAETTTAAGATSSTDMHLLRKCPCPVWLVRPAAAARPRRVMAAVDPQPTDPTGTQLNGLILDLAESLAAEAKGALHVVHAYEVSRLLKAVDSSRAEELRRDGRQMAESELRALLADRAFVASEHVVEVVEGRASQVIASHARENEIDILVMGTVARVGIAGLFMGNTAERVLNEVTCSVVAVKPHGFVSPIRLVD